VTRAGRVREREAQVPEQPSRAAFLDQAFRLGVGLRARHPEQKALCGELIVHRIQGRPSNSIRPVRAVRIHEEGGPEVVLVDRIPEPEPAPGEALVRMHASALNRIDVWIRLGKPSRPKPHTLGADGAGVVEALGPGTEGPAPGTPVVINPGLFCGICEACLRGQQSLCERFAVLGEHVPGTHADYCVVPVRSLHPKPEPLSFAEAAAYPLVFATAWRMLMTRARLVPGEWILVWGAGSGVGSAAVTLASSLGARVIATASRDEGHWRWRASEERTPPSTIAATTCSRLVRELTDGRGADVVYEHVGADTWATSIEALRRGGRLVITGATTGGNPPARLHRIFWKQLDVLGSTMASDSEFRAVTRLFAQGRIRPLVDSVRPLEEVQAAQAAARGRRAERQARAPDRRCLRRCCSSPTARSPATRDPAAGRSCWSRASTAASSRAASRTRPTTAWSYGR